jgi:heme-degrading monooxygenase HmoA
MIARIWQGAVGRADADAYADYMSATGLPGYRNTAGNVAALMLRRYVNEKCEFLMLSLWDSMESIRAFAGDEPDKAVFYPEDDRFLVERELTVRHYELDPRSGIEAGATLRQDE